MSARLSMSDIYKYLYPMQTNMVFTYKKMKIVHSFLMKKHIWHKWHIVVLKQANGRIISFSTNVHWWIN